METTAAIVGRRSAISKAPLSTHLLRHALSVGEREAYELEELVGPGLVSSRTAKTTLP